MSSGFAAGIRDIAIESGGVAELFIVTPAAMPELKLAAALGDPIAERLLFAINATLHGVKQTPERQSLLCQSCSLEREQTDFSFAVLEAHRDDPSVGLIVRICRYCAPLSSDVEKKVGAGLAKLFPGLQKIELHPAVGTA